MAKRKRADLARVYNKIHDAVDSLDEAYTSFPYNDEPEAKTVLICIVELEKALRSLEKGA